MAPGKRSPIGVLFFTVFLDLLGFGMVIPILPIYAERMDARAVTVDPLFSTDFKIGILLAVYSVMQLFFSPMWGRLSDRHGRRPILLVSILGSCASQLGFALAPSFWWLVVARALAGACGANITAAQAYIADVTDEKSRASGMGILGAAMGLGFVCGPAAGGLLTHFGDRVPFFAASALAALNFALAIPILVEPRARGDRSTARALSWAGLVRTVSTPRLLGLILLFFLITFAFANLEATFSLYLERRFRYDRAQASYLFVYIGVLMIAVQGGLVRPLAASLGEKTLVVIGTLLMAIGLIGFHYAEHLPLLLVVIGVVSIGNGLNNPSLSSLISRAAGGDRQGGVLGVSQSFGALARVVGPLVGTWALHFGASIPYLMGGAVMTAACLFGAAVVRQPRLPPEPATNQA